MKSSTIAVNALIAGLIFTQPAQGVSLWNNSRNNQSGYLADKIARQVGDILTIVVSETTAMNTSLSTKTNKTANITDSVTQFLYSAAADKFTTYRGEFPKTTIDGKNTYDAGGTIDNKSTLTASAAVRVIDILPNGNLVIEGTRVVSFSGDSRYAVLRGIVNPYDIAIDNTIASGKISDAQLDFISEGEITDAQRKGWLLKLNDTINPF